MKNNDTIKDQISLLWLLLNKQVVGIFIYKNLKENKQTFLGYLPPIIPPYNPPNPETAPAEAAEPPAAAAALAAAEPPPIPNP